MYSLTLTYDERRAIDWIGNRYSHGDGLYKLLIDCPDTFDGDDFRDMWSEPTNLTFSIPEHVAWQINDIGEECEYRWDCFAESLANKLTQFCDSIV